MQTVLLSSLPQKKLAQLLNSILTPAMYVSVEGFSYDEKLGAILYTIEFGIQHGQSVNIQRSVLRYSTLNKMDQQLRENGIEFKIQSRFPPKRLLGNKNPQFVEQRAEKLQNYLKGLLKIPEIVTCRAFLGTFNLTYFE